MITKVAQQPLGKIDRQASLRWRERLPSDVTENPDGRRAQTARRQVLGGLQESLDARPGHFLTFIEPGTPIGDNVSRRSVGGKKA